MFVTGLLEDEYNKTGHLRRKCVETTNNLANMLKTYGEIVNPGFVEHESDAERATQIFNTASVDLIVVELAYQKGTVSAGMFLNTTAPMCGIPNIYAIYQKTRTSM